MIIYILKFFLKVFYDPIVLGAHTFRWRSKNKHNHTYPIVLFPLEKVTVGRYTYGPLDVYSYTQKNDESLQIGDFCSIAKGVKFILGGNHHYNIMSTYPFKTYFQNEEEAFSKGPIIIENDVWIGTGSLILSGVRLEQGCVVAAGAVVTKSFPAYSIIGGNPAKLIKKRFDDTIIDELLHLEYQALNEEIIKKNMQLFYNEDIKSSLTLLKNQN